MTGPSPSSATAVSVHVPMWLLVLVTLSGTLAMHIFVPALPLAGQALQEEAGRMQLTITLYVIGLAVGQLIYGPLSDAIGRRPALLAGLTLYLGASIMAWLAPSLSWLMVARTLQALGGAAGLALGRAIVRDVSTPERATRNLALLNMLTMIGPGLAPALGSLLVAQSGWRAIFAFLVLLALLIWISTWRILQETVPQRRPVQIGRIGSDYAALLRNRSFLGFALGGSCVTTALYAYVASAPYIIHEQLAEPIWLVGPLMAVPVVGSALGTFLTRQLTGRLTARTILYVGTGLGLGASVLLLVLDLGSWLAVPWLAFATFVLALGSGLASPASLSGALQVPPHLTGSAAGMYGFAQMGVGALNTFLVGFGKEPALSCAVVLIGSTGLAAWCFRSALRAQREKA